MSVTAADVNKALRRHVIPLLRSTGFADGTGRKFWRHAEGKVDHIEIGSLSTYRALTDDATTASFHVRLGISLSHYGFQNDPFYKDFIKTGPGGPRPAETQMPIRGVLCPKSSPALIKKHWGWECQSLWSVGSIEEAERSAHDLREQLEGYALGWMDREWNLRQFLDLLQSKEARLFIATTENGSHLQLNAELYGSPIRRAHVAMVESAIEAGK